MGCIYFYCDTGDTIAPVMGKGRDGVFIDNKSSFLHAVNLFFSVCCNLPDGSRFYSFTAMEK